MSAGSAFHEILGIIGLCGNRQVFLGFAPARLLYDVSFADTLDEDTGLGYQRPRDKAHSLDFRRYISQPDASTIPLTFNLRAENQDCWSIQTRAGQCALRLRHGTPCLAQVDCQHRLGELGDVDVPLAFMAFIGLDLRNEMAMFTIINSKSRGLSRSLTDFHRSNLVENLAEVAPELFIARQLNEMPDSPWCGLIRYGGKSTSGLKRKTSLRMMQKSIRRFLGQTKYLERHDASALLNLFLCYWRAVAQVFSTEWENHRTHLITKGVGLCALTQLLGSLVRANPDRVLEEEFFVEVLSRLDGRIDWGTHGTFANAGGHKGANEAHAHLKGALGL